MQQQSVDLEGFSELGDKVESLNQFNPNKLRIDDPGLEEEQTFETNLVKSGTPRFRAMTRGKFGINEQDIIWAINIL